MRRADRLFRIVQLLRRRKLTTAKQLADELEVSERTVYRDVADLVGSGVPIRGEAGVGYALERGFDLPPLMFTEDELEALVLGVRVVESWGDATLGSAARSVVHKVEAVLPERLQDRIGKAPLFAPGFHVPAGSARELGTLRRAIRERRKARMSYVDRALASTERTVRPLGLFFWGASWTVAAWCELRQGFRGFRLDRVQKLELTDQRFDDEAGQTLADFFDHIRQGRIT
ncbi:MAG TPA: YafY family protein [Polyangia bacterium]|jgi:predicted DNA-binding transcriptional regulator YafY|nr:YafY family protein [Polyangia bacterium]